VFWVKGYYSVFLSTVAIKLLHMFSTLSCFQYIELLSVFVKFQPESDLTGHIYNDVLATEL